MKVAAPGPVDEGNEFVVAKTLDMAVHPNFNCEWRLRPFGVGLNLVRRTIDDEHVAAIGLPARGAGRCPKMLVGVGRPVVVLFFKLVGRGARSGIAVLPELLNKAVLLTLVLVKRRGRLSRARIAMPPKIGRRRQDKWPRRAATTRERSKVWDKANDASVFMRFLPVTAMAGCRPENRFCSGAATRAYSCALPVAETTRSSQHFSLSLRITRENHHTAG